MDVSKEYDGTFTLCSSVEAAKEFNRIFRSDLAHEFRTGCSFDNVLKTCVLSPDTYSWLDRSNGITYVGVHGMGDSICVVTRRTDLDMTPVTKFKKVVPKCKLICRLPGAIMSEIEGLPYDVEFCKKSGLSIKKPFGVVSVASTVEYDKNKAINFLEEKMESESAITFDETIKTAISAFQHLCLQELKAEDLWVTAWNGGETLCLHLNEIEAHLAAINSGFGRSGSSRNKDEMMEDLGVIKSGYGSSDFTNKVTKGISSLKVCNDEILI